MSESNMVSIIIINWNTRDLLTQCLQSIGDSDIGVDYEVIVVDNASSDDSVEAVRTRFPWVRLMENRENRGFGAANNQGAAISNGQYLLFLNPDTVVSTDSVSVMQRFLASKEEAGIVGCRILNPDGSVQPSWWTGYPSIRWCWESAVYMHNGSRKKRDSGAGQDAGPVTVSHLLGACIMVRRDVFEKLGGFDERYFLYLEETDLCYRAALMGKQNYYLPDGSIIHLGQQSSMQSADWTNVQLQFSTYAFIRQHTQLNGAKRMVLMLGMEFGCLVRIVLWTARLIIGNPKRRTSLLMLRGYARLFLRIGEFETLLRRHSGRAVRLP